MGFVNGPWNLERKATVRDSRIKSACVCVGVYMCWCGCVLVGVYGVGMDMWRCYSDIGKQTCWILDNFSDGVYVCIKGLHSTHYIPVTLCVSVGCCDYQ